MEEVAQEIQQIEPPVFPQIERVEVRPGLQVIVVSVSQGPNCPYSYKGQAFRRVGNTSPKMSRDEYNRVLIERFHGERRWETERAEDWKVTDLDAAELTRTLDEAIRRGRMAEPGTRDPYEILRGFGLLKDDHLVRAAVVLFGMQARLEAEFPQCLLRVAKFKGADKTEFADNRQFHGNAFRLLLSAEQFLRENLPIAGRVVPDLSSARTTRSIRRQLCARHWRMPSATVITRSAADRSRWRSIRIAWKSPRRDRSISD